MTAVAAAVLLAVLLWPSRSPRPSRRHRGRDGAGRDGASAAPTRSFPMRSVERADRPAPAERVELLALCLRAGLGAHAAREVVAAVTGSSGSGADPLLLTRAWSLSDELGAPLADAVETCARVVRREEEARRRRVAVVAGPRASMWLLTALPVAGPVAALLVGVDVGAVYVESAAGRVGLLAGGLLTGLGWWLSRRILRRATRPRRYA